MTTIEIEQKLLNIIRETLKIRRQDLSPDLRFKEDLGADSLDLVNLILVIEEEFGINIPEESTANLLTIGEALSLIEKFRQ